MSLPSPPVSFTVTARLVQAEVPGPEPANRCDQQLASAATDATTVSGASVRFSAYDGSYQVWLDPWYFLLPQYWGAYGVPPGTAPSRWVGVNKRVTRGGKTSSWRGFIYMGGGGCAWNIGVGSVIVPDDYVPIWALAGCPHQYYFAGTLWWAPYYTIYEGVVAWVRPARLPCKGPLGSPAIWWWSGPQFLSLQTDFPVPQALVELAFSGGGGTLTITGLGGPGSLTKRYFTLQANLSGGESRVTLEIRGYPYVPPLTLMLENMPTLEYAKVWPPAVLGTLQGTLPQPSLPSPPGVRA